MGKGFLRRAAEGDEYDPSVDEESIETQYLRMFPKIGRDFVTKEDFARTIQAILDLIDPNNEHYIDYDSDTGAMTLAVHYKDIVDGRDSTDESVRDIGAQED